MSEEFGFIARSQPIQDVVQQARQVAQTDVPVLIVGPDGSGRKRLAEFIHYRSPRRGAAFHLLDCDLLAEQQWYSRLFGHVAGAFPGATADRVGLFQVVAGGTLLLREIDRAPHDLQTHLQRILEDKTFRPLGREEEPVPVACRVIATATRDDAGDGLAVGLRSLLAGSIIRLPPLCEHTDDIPDLIEYFLAVYNGQRGKQLKHPDADLMARLCRLPWDGNVQQLENAIAAAVEQASDDRFLDSLLPESIRENLERLPVGTPPGAPSAAPPDLSLADVSEKLVQQVEELTLRILDGGLLPVPAAALSCDVAALEQPLLKEIVQGTLRACRKHLVQRIHDVRDRGETATLRRLGLHGNDNPLHLTVAQTLRPTIEEILLSDDPAGIAILLGLGEALPSYRGDRRPSATFDEVCRVHDKVEETIRQHAGKRPTRDQMAQELREFLGKHVSAGLVTKVRKALGKDKQRAPRPKKIGMAQAEEEAAVQQHAEERPNQTEFTSQVEQEIDAQEYRQRLETMHPAELDSEARRLEVPLGLEREQMLDTLDWAHGVQQALADSDADGLLDYVRHVGMPDETCRDSCQRDALIRRLLREAVRRHLNDS